MLNEQVYFAYRPRKPNSNIFDKAILYKKQKDSITSLVKFEESTIFNSEDILFSAKIETQLFYGWSVNFVEKNNSFSTIYHTDEGNHLTDGPILVWDYTVGKFKKSIIDKSMY